jgi:hypothetical protein
MTNIPVEDVSLPKRPVPVIHIESDPNPVYGSPMVGGHTTEVFDQDVPSLALHRATKERNAEKIKRDADQQELMTKPEEIEAAIDSEGEIEQPESGFLLNLFDRIVKGSRPKHARPVTAETTEQRLDRVAKLEWDRINSKSKEDLTQLRRRRNIASNLGPISSRNLNRYRDNSHD